MTSCVYLANHITESRFKIGKADNFYNRVKILGVENFDLECVWIVFASSKSSAFSIESSLHAAFDRYRIKDLPRSDGYTEWFDMDCKPDVLDFLADIEADGSKRVQETWFVNSPKRHPTQWIKLRSDRAIVKRQMEAA